jgi:hypothetical protein
MTDAWIMIFLVAITSIAALYLSCAIALLLSLLLNASNWELIDMTDRATRRKFERATGVEVVQVIENISYVVRVSSGNDFFCNHV